MTIGLKVATGHYYKYICDFSQSGEIHKIWEKPAVYGQGNLVRKGENYQNTENRI